MTHRSTRNLKKKHNIISEDIFLEKNSSIYTVLLGIAGK